MQRRTDSNAVIAVEIVRGRSQEQDERKVVHGAEVKQNDFGIGPQFRSNCVDQNDYGEAPDR